MHLQRWSLVQAENLKENVFYEFQVRAMNMAGLSKASVPSAVLECKEWTITLPGMQKRHLRKDGRHDTEIAKR